MRKWREGGEGKKMSSWRQTTKHVICPAAAHLPIHVQPVPEAATKSNLYVSITLLPSSRNSASFILLSLVSPLVWQNYNFWFSLAGFFLSPLHSLSCVLFSLPLSSTLSACYRDCSSFTNFSCPWQLITQIEPLVVPRLDSESSGGFLWDPK